MSSVRIHPTATQARMPCVLSGTTLSLTRATIESVAASLHSLYSHHVSFIWLLIIVFVDVKDPKLTLRLHHAVFDVSAEPAVAAHEDRALLHKPERREYRHHLESRVARRHLVLKPAARPGRRRSPGLL